MELTLRNSHRSFAGTQQYYSHPSAVCPTEMRFSIYLPDSAKNRRLPVLYWLSGLTCTEDNFTVKSGVQRWASQYGWIVVASDTSPRGAGIPGESESYDLGVGAGFYVNATQPPWSSHYHMYDYVVEELPKIVEAQFPIAPDSRYLSGHSMGGHGALTIALKNPNRYRAASAFSPICAPSQCPWGQKAFSAYLGSDKSVWAEHDANELVRSRANLPPVPLLVDQGLADPFLREQLRLDLFEQTCEQVHYPLTIRRREGYDHSYFYIATFLEEHFQFFNSNLAEKA